MAAEHLFFYSMIDQLFPSLVKDAFAVVLRPRSIQFLLDKFFCVVHKQLRITLHGFSSIGLHGSIDPSPRLFFQRSTL